MGSSMKVFSQTVFLLVLYMLVSNAHSETLEELTKKCGMCHGADGNSLAATIPSIAGITQEYFVHTMDAYQNNGRQSDMMKMYVHTLSGDDIKQLAEHYSALTFKPREQDYDAEKAKQGKELHDKYCEKCHENAGRITENNYGILAGQWVPYLKQAIQDYLNNKRRVNPMMITKLKKMQQAAGDESIELVLHYYASLKE